MPSTDQIIEALRPVEDPELHRSIVDLEMVREVSLEGETVRVLIALTVPGCPMKAEIDKRVTDALIGLEGVSRVEVEMTSMTPEQLAELKQRLEVPGGGHQHAPSPFATSNTRVITITSGKGGVGKSTIAVNLAVALAAGGQRVGIMDADVYGFSVPGILGVDEEPVLDGDTIVPPEVNGVACMSIAYFVEPGRPVMWRGPMLHKAVEQFLSDVKWGELDYLIVDTPPGTGDVAMSVAKQLPRAETIVVTTPQPAAQTVAQRSGAMAREIGSPVVGVIENMSYFEDSSGQRVELFGAGGGKVLAGQLDCELLATIPLYPSLREGGDDGEPALVSAPESPEAQIFRDLAKALVSSGPRRVYRQELQIR